MVWVSASASKCILSLKYKEKTPLQYTYTHTYLHLAMVCNAFFFQIKAFPLRKYTDITRNARAHGFGITNILSLIFFLFLTEVK